MTNSSSSVRRRAASGYRALPGILALTMLAACDIPSSAPIIQQRWVVPSQTTRIAVGTLLPSGVAILTDNSGFSVTASSAAVTRTLGQDCATCAAANGQTIPKPAFTAAASATTSLPSDISSAVLTGGTLQVVVANNYSFDPIRPSAAGARGYAVITVSNGTTVIGKDSVNGAQFALPANGGSITRSIALAGTVSGASPITVSLNLNSPAGDVVTINSNSTISVTATPTNLRVASANVAVVNRQVTSSTTIDLHDIDQTISDKVKGGALLLTVTNPFAVTGTLQVRLTTGATTITKTVALGTGTTSPSISFSESELKSLLGNVVTVTFSGPVNAAGPINVTPTQAIVVASRLDLTIEVGG